MTIPYYYLILSQKDIVENQVLEEILRERTSYYVSKNKMKDFWTLMSPKFIQNLNLDKKIVDTNFYSQKKEEISTSTNTKFYASLISLDKDFINWIQLRLGYFENINQNVDSKIKSKYVSDGIIGQFLVGDLNNNSPLDYNENLIHPDLILKKYKSVLNLSYSNNN